MEGFLGSRSSLALSIFNNVLRPRFTSSAKGPFYSSRSEGLNAGWSYPLTNTDSVAVNYSLSHMHTDYSFALRKYSHWVACERPARRDFQQRCETGAGRTTLGVSGCPLPIPFRASGWAEAKCDSVPMGGESLFCPTRFSVAGRPGLFERRSVAPGATMATCPQCAWLFSGEPQVRSRSSGELGPHAVFPSVTSSGNQTYSACPAGRQ